nr:MAG TPA: Putative ATP dependent Clp protease [Caudoviricetes sp.]
MNKVKKFWEIKNEAESETAEILIYGQLADQPWYGDETGPKDFANDLKTLGGKDILLRINSPGGDVFAAQAIYNLLKAYSGKVTVHIDGLCASAATLVACAADSVIMPRNALYMVHNPQAFFFDMMDAETLKKSADIMEKVKDTIVSVYAGKCKDKIEPDKLKGLMNEETWMDADEALANGFVDEIDEDYTVQTQMKAGMVIMNSVSMKFSDTGMSKIRNIVDKEKKMEDKELLAKIKNLLGLGGQPPQGKEDPAVTAERQRISDLEALKTEDANPYVVAFIEKCKVEGTTAEAAKPFVDTLAGIQPVAKGNPVFDKIKALIEDNLDSGADGVKPQPKAKEPAPQEKKQAEIKDIIDRINKIRGTK